MACACAKKVEKVRVTLWSSSSNSSYSPGLQIRCSLNSTDRMWALRRLRHLINTTDDVMKALKNCAPLPPPHNPSAALPAAASPYKPGAGTTPYQSGALVGLPAMSPLSATTLVRSPILPATPASGLAALVQSLPEMLLRQFEYEDPIVRGGKHLLHSPFFKVSRNDGWYIRYCTLRYVIVLL